MTNNPQGLVRTIGRWSLTALMVNSIVGVSIFKLPADLAYHLGGWSPLSCVAAGAGILVIAGCIAEVSSRYEETGGLYLYARDALGRFAGLLVAWMTWLTRIAAPAAAANLVWTYTAKFFPGVGSAQGKFVVLFLLMGHLALLNCLGVKMGKQLSNLFTAVKVGFLLAFVFAGCWALVARPELRVPLSLPAVSAKTWFETMLLLVYAYGGFEGALFVGGETTNPKRDTPIALLAALGVVCLIYTAVQYVTMATLPAAGMSARPLADAAQRFLGTGGAAAIAMAALISGYGYLSANVLHAPRITYALAEQGDFPAFLGIVHPKYRTPYVSILIYAVLVFLFALIGDFQWNALLSAVSRLAVYGAMALAVPILRSRKDGKAQFLLPAPYLFAGLGVLFSVVLASQMGRSEFAVVGTTSAIAFVNWVVVRR
ncbi:MAG TPA: APC family permease [Candidatus Acidoferrum sp.]|nr:APC family permease [Candidatus Acidoferrum sp.]